MVNMKKRFLPLVVCGLCWISASHAANGVAIETGRGDSTDMGRVALFHQWGRKWFTDGNWYVGGYWEVSLGRWNSTAAGGKEIWDLGITPVFRLQSKAATGFRPYVEAAVGLHLIDHTHVNNNRDMSTAFQFGDHVGVGLLLGDKGQFDLGYRFQHLSNADIKKPNNGINFQQIRLGYSF
jgi:lipid A 3-O-deacylase